MSLQDKSQLLLWTRTCHVCCSSSNQFYVSQAMSIYGFRFQARKCDSTTKNTKQYREQFTLTFTDGSNGANVATHTFDAKVKYGGHVDILLVKPFIPTCSTLQTFTISFTDQTQRAYPHFQLTTDTSPGLFYPYSNQPQNWCSVSQLLYKLG
jgi:hypothetical protein